MARQKLTYAEAADYVWLNSHAIRNWYKSEHGFDLDDYTRAEYRTFGYTAPGDTIAEIVSEGVRDGIILEDENGEYFAE